MVGGDKAMAGLVRENATIKAEAQRMGRNVQPRKWQRIIENAATDARRILHLRYAGISTGRRWLAEAGIVTAWRYGWANGLLRAATVDALHLDTIEALGCAIAQVDATETALLADGLNGLKALRQQSGLRYELGRYGMEGDKE